jgi:NAD(P)H-dependent flavin oxidoreductase YrpB (nitropropane dioxygenase family)
MMLPKIIQGGMGIGVSDWRLAGAVGRAGGLGVVSGVALDSMLARRLQDGDHDGQLRQALAHFPVPEIAEKVLTRYFRRGGRPADQPYRLVPRLNLQPSLDRLRLAVVAAFAEIHLARRAGGGARVGINLLEKIQLATPATAYGALLADVDVVLVGAGIPARLPRLLSDLAAQRPVDFPIDVAGAGPSRHTMRFDPVAVLGRTLAAVRPLFFAIVSSNTLATYLARDAATRPDGFVVEGGTAGGHNAPPRGALRLDGQGNPVYGPRDAADVAQFAQLGLPFWLAGGYSQPERVAAACAAGAAGVQVGTLFALSRDSNLAPSLRRELLAALRAGYPEVRTDPRASPTGFPFKVTQVPGTLSDAAVYEQRPRVCDLSYLRIPYEKPDGTIGYRCPAEPVDAYLRKGGERAATVGRVCLCNALMAAVGLAQRQHDGGSEPAISTLGADLDGARELLARHPDGWGAADVIAYLSGQSPAPAGPDGRPLAN